MNKPIPFEPSESCILVQTHIPSSGYSVCNGIISYQDVQMDQWPASTKIYDIKSYYEQRHRAIISITIVNTSNL